MTYLIYFVIKNGNPNIKNFFAHIISDLGCVEYHNILEFKYLEEPLNKEAVFDSLKLCEVFAYYNNTPYKLSI